VAQRELADLQPHALIAGHCERSKALDGAIARFALRYAHQAASEHARLVCFTDIASIAMYRSEMWLAQSVNS